MITKEDVFKKFMSDQGIEIEEDISTPLVTGMAYLNWLENKVIDLYNEREAIENLFYENEQQCLCGDCNCEANTVTKEENDVQ